MSGSERHHRNSLSFFLLRIAKLNLHTKYEIIPNLETQIQLYDFFFNWFEVNTICLIIIERKSNEIKRISRIFDSTSFNNDTTRETDSKWAKNIEWNFNNFFSDIRVNSYNVQ